MSVFTQVAALFILILFGWIARKLSILSAESVKGMSGLLLNVSLPSLMISSMQRPFSRELMGEAFAVLGISFAIYILSFPLSLGLGKLFRSPKGERGVLEYSVVFANVAFMGFPVTEALYGKEALFHACFCNVPFSLLAFSLGAYLIARDGEKPLKLSPRIFLNLNVFGALIGFLLFVFSISIPAPILSALSLAGSLTTPLAMIIVGSVLASSDPRKSFAKPRVFIFAFIRLFALPLAVFFTLKALGFTGLSLFVPSVLAAMPAAANTSIVSVAYGGDSETASALIFVTTLASVLSIPLLAAAFFH